jgi:hypothetical protein
MAFIMLWRQDGHQCFLVVGGSIHPYIVRLVDHHMGVLREQPATDPDHALRIATIWHELEMRGAFGSSDPSADVVPAA